MRPVDGRRITNDEQYAKALQWLVEKAQLLDHPLLEPEKKERLMKLYDFVAERVRKYRLNGPPAPPVDDRANGLEGCLTAAGENSEAEEYTDWLDE